MKQAKLQGVQYYFTGSPCKRGHVEKRYSSDGSCVSCAIDRATERYANKKGEILEYHKNYYRENSEIIKKRVNDRRLANPDKVAAEKKAEYQKHKKAYIDRAVKWAKNNPDKMKICQMNWVKNNSLKAYLIVVRRRMAKLKRTPLWLSNNDKLMIKNIYAIATRVSKETGVKHHVDHVIPLRGDLVSGLHVPDNLQLLTASANMSKGNRFVTI